MTAERAIELLGSGAKMLSIPHSAEELDEACRMACDALRLYGQRTVELTAADKAGRVIVLPDASCTDADGEEALRKAMWDCNYQNNGVTRFAADAIAEKLCREAQKSWLSVKTPLGDIVAEASTDLDNPGVWISLHQQGEEHEPTLALVEYTETESDQQAPVLVTRVWRDTHKDEYTDRVIHAGLEKDGAK